MSNIPECLRDNAIPRVSPDKMPCMPVLSCDNVMPHVSCAIMVRFWVCILDGVIVLSFFPENHHRMYLSGRVEVELFEGKEVGVGCSGVFFGDECFPVEGIVHGTAARNAVAV